MAENTLKKAGASSSSSEIEKPALRVERFRFSDSAREAIKVNLQIAKNASKQSSDR
jgi:hypothetical protein